MSRYLLLKTGRVLDKEAWMGQVHTHVILTNYREALMAQLSQLAPERVHRYETEALIDTGATRSVIPPAIAERLGLLRLRRTVAQYADGRGEEVDLSEVFTIEILGREVNEDAMIVGTQILLGVTVLEKLDLLVDCTRQRLIPHPDRPDQPVFRI